MSDTRPVFCVYYRADKIVKRWLVSYRQSFCCEDAREAWSEKFIGFGDYEGKVTDGDPVVSIYHCDPYPEGSAWDDRPISFCPFCATPIEFIRMEGNGDE